jgi:hypothetical protein
MRTVEMARESVPPNLTERQLGPANLGITSVYLQGNDNAEIIGTVYARRAPMLPASAGLAWQADARWQGAAVPSDRPLTARARRKQRRIALGLRRSSDP